jgi:hypothetical protein
MNTSIHYQHQSNGIIIKAYTLQHVSCLTNNSANAAEPCRFVRCQLSMCCVTRQSFKSKGKHVAMLYTYNFFFGAIYTPTTLCRGNLVFLPYAAQIKGNMHPLLVAIKPAYNTRMPTELCMPRSNNFAPILD